MKQNTTLLSLLLISAVSFSLWLIHNNYIASNAIVSHAAQTPDAFMLNAVYTRYDKFGNVHSQIAVPRMVHFETNDTSDFNNPKMTFYDEHKTPWHISANFGKSQSGIEQVDLWGNVIIQQSENQHSHGMLINTFSLIIFPKEQIALTDQPITLKQPGAIINSVGLRANFKSGQVELLSHAHAIYNLKD